MKTKFFAIIVVGFFLMPNSVFATPAILKRFVASYPSVVDSQLDSCRTCHMPALNKCLNIYGQGVKEKVLDFAALEGLDSDNDGKSNIEEITMLHLPGSQADADEFFLFTNRMGNISFNHEKHSLDEAYLSNGKCDNCHASELFPRHFDDTSPRQEVAHKVCKECHKKSERPNAPVRCKQCHIKEKPS